MLSKLQAPTLSFLALQSLQETAKAQTWTNLFDWHGQNTGTYNDSYFTGSSEHLTTFTMFMNTNSQCGSYVHGFQLNGAGVSVPTDSISGDVRQTLTLSFPQAITEIDVNHYSYKGFYFKSIFTTT